MTTTTKKLGKRIQELRKQRNLTQSQLAEKINVEVVTISRIENGSRFPKRENLENIARTLNVPIKDLFDFEHHAGKSLLLKEINAMLKSVKLEDIQYFYRILKMHIESR